MNRFALCRRERERQRSSAVRGSDKELQYVRKPVNRPVDSESALLPDSTTAPARHCASSAPLYEPCGEAFVAHGPFKHRSFSLSILYYPLSPMRLTFAPPTGAPLTLASSKSRRCASGGTEGARQLRRCARSVLRLLTHYLALVRASVRPRQFTTPTQPPHPPFISSSPPRWRTPT